MPKQTLYNKYANMLLGFPINFFSTRTILHLVSCFLPVCKNHTIYCMSFILVSNNSENVSFSVNIVVVCVSFTCGLSTTPPLFKDTDSWLPGVSHWTPTIQAVSHISIQRIELTPYFFNSF